MMLMKLLFLLPLFSILLANLAFCQSNSDSTTVPPIISPNTCNSCAGICTVYNISGEGGRCKCDADCEAYGDCCGVSPAQRSSACSEQLPNPDLEGLEFVCRSVYLDSSIEVMENEAFWMVTSCQDNWLREIEDIERGRVILSNCLSDNSTLPPVSDAVTGIVYKNEYCVACNRVENPIIAWQVHLGCSSRIYDLLGSAPTSQTITMILEDDPEIFQRECRPCQYEPPNIQPPRACFPMISTCLNETELESRTGREFSQNHYEGLVDQCMNGVYDLHGTMSLGSVIIGPPPTPQYMILSPIYRNLACAQCNAANTSTVTCLSDRNIRMSVPFQCMPEMGTITTTSTSHPTHEMTTTSRPTTSATTQHSATTTTAPRQETSASLLLPTNAPTVHGLVLNFGLNLTINRLGIEHERAFRPYYAVSWSIPSSLIPVGPEEPPVDDQTPGIPFSISLSNLGGGQVVIHVESVEVNVTLDCPEGQAPVGLECRDTLCPNGYVSTGGRCFFQFGKKVNGPFVNNDTNMTMQFGNDSLGSGFFLDCPSELVLVSDNDFT
jgi:hypothetical protein